MSTVTWSRSPAGQAVELGPRRAQVGHRLDRVGAVARSRGAGRPGGPSPRRWCRPARPPGWPGAPHAARDRRPRRPGCQSGATATPDAAETGGVGHAGADRGPRGRRPARPAGRPAAARRPWRTGPAASSTACSSTAHTRGRLVARRRRLAIGVVDPVVARVGGDRLRRPRASRRPGRRGPGAAGRWPGSGSSACAAVGRGRRRTPRSPTRRPAPRSWPDRCSARAARPATSPTMPRTARTKRSPSRSARSWRAATRRRRSAPSSLCGPPTRRITGSVRGMARLPGSGSDPPQVRRGEAPRCRPNRYVRRARCRPRRCRRDGRERLEPRSPTVVALSVTGASGYQSWSV